MACLTLFQSCLMTYGDYMHNTYTPLEKAVNVQKSNKIYLFFNGEPIDFKYKKLGLIECQGYEYAKHSAILDHLKYQAWRNNANAIINISDGLNPRETGYLFDSTPNVYQAKVFKGIAVSIDIDSAFIAKYGNNVDTSFIANVQWANLQHGEKQESQFVISILATILAIVVVIIAVASEKEKTTLNSPVFR